MIDIIIVGAGPAGLTAALYALRANKKVLVIEAKTYGGQIIKANLVKNYPAIKEIKGLDYAKNLYEQVVSLGGKIIYETVLKINPDKTVVTNKNSYEAKAIIIATGAENRKLNLPKEQDFVGKGVSYCATCDGNFFKNQVVAVVGGGNTAIDDALYLADITKKVYVIHRHDVFNGEEKEVNELKTKKNVEFILNAEVTSLEGSDFLTSINIKKSDGSEENLEVKGLFIAIGQEPRNEIFANLVDLDDYGYILTIDEVKTKVKGIYVAGDARKKMLRQLTTAVSDGSLAATIAIKEMNEGVKNEE